MPKKSRKEPIFFGDDGAPIAWTKGDLDQRIVQFPKTRPAKGTAFVVVSLRTDTGVRCEIVGQIETQQAYEISALAARAISGVGSKPAAGKIAYPSGCPCVRCMDAAGVAVEIFGDMIVPASGARMVLCPTCQNKRCPHASDCTYQCTGSNEPGQVGSSYEHVTLQGDPPALNTKFECPTCGVDRFVEPCKNPQNCGLIGTAYNSDSASKTVGSKLKKTPIIQALEKVEELLIQAPSTPSHASSLESIRELISLHSA
jgi:hypothetical protein